MADELVRFYGDVLQLIARLYHDKQITKDQKSHLKDLLIENEDFIQAILAEYKELGIKAVEDIFCDDNTSMCSFRDLLMEESPRRKRSRSMTHLTDGSV